MRLATDRSPDARTVLPTVAALFAPAVAGHDSFRTLIYLFGEHNFTNRDAVAALLDQATPVDETDVSPTPIARRRLDLCGVVA